MAGLYYADPVIKTVEKQVNDMGGILGGRPVKVVKYDQRANVADTVAGAKKLIVEDKVSALVFGGIFTNECTAVADVAEELKVLYVSNAPLENVAKWKFTVEATLPNRAVVDDIVKLVTQTLKPRTVAMLSAEGDYTRTTTFPGWKRGIEAAGIDVVYSDITPVDVQDFMPYLTKIKYIDPDVLLIIEDSAPSVTIAKQIMELGGWGHTQVVTHSGALSAAKQPGAKGWLILTMWHPSFDDPASTKFKEAYQAANGKLPEVNHVFYYLALWTAIHAIELAGTAEDTEAIGRAARSGNLEWDTPAGRAHYNTEGDSGLGGMFLQIQEGGTTVRFKQ